MQNGRRAARSLPKRPARRLLGARKLERLLIDRDISGMAFARLCGVTRVQLHRVITGATRQVYVDFALRVEKGSDGEIVVRDFASDTVSVPLRRRPPTSPPAAAIPTEERSPAP